MTEEEKDKAGKEQNEFINQRLTWLGTFEGLLFAADHFSGNQHLLPLLLPIVGFAFAVSVSVGTYAANRVLDKLKRQAFQDSQSAFKRKLKYLMPGTAIPGIIAIAWTAILIDRLR